MNLTMGVWNFYFLAKLYLYFSGSIRLDLFVNLLFAAFLLAPVPANLGARKSIEAARTVLGVFIAMALLWRDSWLPPPFAAWRHLVSEGIPSAQYIFAFLLRYIVTIETAIVIAALAVCILIRKNRFLTPVTIVLLLLSPLASLVAPAPKGGGAPPSVEAIFEEPRQLARLTPDESAESTESAAMPLPGPLAPAEESAGVKEEPASPAPVQAEAARMPETAPAAETPPPSATPRHDAWEPINEMDPQRYTDAFFSLEARRKVEFRDIRPGEAKFDILFIHICSLSWDDLLGTTVNWKGFFKRFDFLFTDFNAVTSYSGPSGQRLLKSNCGQQRHLDLYKEAGNDCYLFPNLSVLGYRAWFPANHDGKYGDYAATLKQYARLAAPIMNPADYKLPVRQYLFDESLVYDDYAALENWWKKRLASGDDRAAAYYNTATLHDGSHRAPKPADWMTRTREQNFNEFVAKLLKDVEKFFALLEASGRNVVVVFVPEHGMALRGSKIQVAGLRDIPLPRINIIPVGFKLFGKGFNGRPARQKVITMPTSYMAITSLLAAMFERSPFGPAPFDAEYLAKQIVRTDHVFENEGMLVVKPDRHYMIFDKRNQWTLLPVD